VKIWRGLLVFLLVVGLAGFMACAKGGKYGEAKELMNKSLTAMEAYINEIDQAKDAKAVAAAIGHFKDSMAALKPKMQALDKKYPELKDETKAPEEVKPLMTKMQEISGKFINASMKAYQYNQDPEVQKAQEELNKLMRE